MGFLQNLLHEITGHGGQAQAPSFGGGTAQHQGPMQQAQQLPAMPYAQYKNADGSGGGFGATNPSTLQVRPGAIDPRQPNLGVGFMQIQGRDNPGYVPLQNSGQGGKGYTANLQPSATAKWQNMSAQPQNYMNPQVQDNGYYFDN